MDATLASASCSLFAFSVVTDPTLPKLEARPSLSGCISRVETLAAKEYSDTQP